MKILQSFVALIVCTVAGCVEDPDLRQISQGLQTVTITGVGYVGEGAQPNDWSPPAPAPTVNSRTFGLYGSFPQPAAGFTYRPHVKCDGRQWPAQILAGYGTAQMNVSIPNLPVQYPSNGTGCLFMLELSDANRANASWSNNGAYFGPISVSYPITITSATDEGQVVAGYHYFSLYDPWLNAANAYSAVVSCSGSAVAATVVSKGAGTVRIRFPYTGAPRDCQIQLAIGAVKSNTWVIRDGSPLQNPAAPAELGAYIWGGYQADAQPPFWSTSAPQKDNLPNAAKKVSDAGYRSTARFVMTPQMRLPSNNNARGKGPSSAVNSLDLTAYWLDANIYDFEPTLCPPGGPTKFLECMARSPQFQAAFNTVSNGGTIVFTANDEATFGAIGYCVPPTPYAGCNSDLGYLSDPTRVAAVRNEYAQFTLALYQTQNNTAKTFVIGNWETENQIYAGGIYPVIDADHRFVARPAGNTPAEIVARKDGLVQWFKLRQDGIRCGIYLATGQNNPGAWCTGTPQSPALTNVKVLDSIEMASMHMAQETTWNSATNTWTGALPNTLSDIVPVVKPAYVTYSAWDTAQARGKVDEDLDAIEASLSTIVSPVTGLQPYLALGELGTIKPAQDSVHEWRNREIIKAAYRAYLPRPGTSVKGPPRMIMWQAFTATIWKWTCNWVWNGSQWVCGTSLQLDPLIASNDDDGLFFPNGYERSFSRTIRSELSNYAATGTFFPRGPTDPYIQNATDLGLTSGRHFFELWGQFPAATGYQVQVTCDGGASTAAIVNFVDPNHTHLQVNIADPGAGTCVNGFRDGKFCTFVVKHASSAWSPIFGPRHVCPGSQGSGLPHPQGQNWGGGCTATCP